MGSEKLARIKIELIGEAIYFLNNNHTIMEKAPPTKKEVLEVANAFFKFVID